METEQSNQSSVPPNWYRLVYLSHNSNKLYCGNWYSAKEDYVAAKHIEYAIEYPGGKLQVWDIQISNSTNKPSDNFEPYSQSY